MKRMTSRAFTLIEVILAMAMLVLLSGGVFGTVRATLAAAATLRDTQQQRQGIYGFIELCRQTFASLPPQAELSEELRKSNSLPELKLRRAPHAFALGARDFFVGETALTARRQNNGALTLGIEYRLLDRWSNEVQPDPRWLPLLKDVQSVNWQFFDSLSGIWREDWKTPNRRPEGIRLIFSFLGSDQKSTQTFWLPVLVPPPQLLNLEALRSMLGGGTNPPPAPPAPSEPPAPPQT